MFGREASMKSRTHLSGAERALRSKARKLLGDEPILRGSLVTMRRTCGKPNCRCTRGEKHEALYLSVRVGRERKMLYVPEALAESVRRAVEGGKELVSLIDRISAESVQKLIEQKQERKR
jgi:hypothetical protein